MLVKIKRNKKIHFVILHFVCIFILFSCSDTHEVKNCSEVRIENGIPSLFINGKPFPPFAYISYLGEKRYYQEAASVGIHLYQFPVYLGDRGINSRSGIGAFRKPIWIAEHEYDYSSIIEDFNEIIAADPHAKVILRIHTDPPQWWEEANPDEVCLLPDGKSFRTSFFSKKWQSEAGKTLQDCVRWLLNSRYADYFVGVHIAGGNTEEWFYHFDQYISDVSLLGGNFRLDVGSGSGDGKFDNGIVYSYNEMTFEPGWNKIELSLAKAKATVQLDAIKYIRFVIQQKGDMVIKFDHIRFYKK